MKNELIIISSGHTSADISIEDLSKMPFILREEGSGTRQVIEETLRKNNLNPTKLIVVLELENTESIKSAVESGMGISILSKVAVQKELSLKTLKRLLIKDLDLKRSLYYIYNDTNLSLPSEVFLDFIFEFYSTKEKN